MIEDDRGCGLKGHCLTRKCLGHNPEIEITRSLHQNLASRQGLYSPLKMMRPLSKEEETDAEVTWEDQNNINTFSKLHNKLQDFQGVLSDKNVQPHSLLWYLS
jgi:hypothetical protein